MKILHYLPRIRLVEGGVVRAVLDLCTLLARAGHQVTLAVCDDADAPVEWAEPDSPNIIVLDKPSRPMGLFGGAGRRRIRRLVETADVVHLHTPWELANAQFARDADRSKTPYILTVHGMLDDWSMAQKPLKKRLFLRVFGRRLLDRAAAVHCTAEAERTQASRWFDGRQARVVPLVFDMDSFRTLPGPKRARKQFMPDGKGPMLLYLSRLHYKKGVEHLIRASAILRERGVACTTLIAGSGDDAYERSLRTLTTELGLDDRVRFLGMVVGDMKVSLYQAADLFVLPTSQENFGFVLIESLAAGTPVITTRGVDIWQELDATGAAEIVEPHHTPIADSIARWLDDPKRRDKAGRDGRAWVLGQFNSGAIARQYEQLYREAIGGP
ncbi:MAG: glycosyltransferase [Planctomycetes bacterium]|nr:glycosyltransferase [Planctomycetota bacterium]